MCKKFAQASTVLDEVTKFTSPKSFNDYTLRLYKTINHLHARQYQQAHDLFQQNNKCRFPTIREQFAIIEAYLYFLSYKGQLNFSKRFRLGKYLNETIQSQANKQGDNIAILIAELLVHWTRDRDRFIDRIDTIQQYAYKYLKSPETERARRLIKILGFAPKANFHGPTLAVLAKRHVLALQKQKARFGEGIAIIEVIPFEDLLDVLLETTVSSQSADTSTHWLHQSAT
ncbi:MAG: hypothetical protein AAFV25_22430 [Bacteroidota bacterium]